MSTSKKSKRENSVEGAPDAREGLKSEKPLSDKDEQDKAIRHSAPLQKQAKKNRTNYKRRNKTAEVMAKRILLIDDDTSVLEILEEVLTDKGFHIVKLTQTDKVFEAIAEHQPELILIDYLLQGINGGEICAEIKRNEKAKLIPVILMTAYPRVLLSLGTYNCDEFLEKPFDLDHLVNRLDYHLDGIGQHNLEKPAPSGLV